MASYCRKQIVTFSYFLFVQFELVIQNFLSVYCSFAYHSWHKENFECHSFCDALFYNTVAFEHIWINI